MMLPTIMKGRIHVDRREGKRRTDPAGEIENLFRHFFTSRPSAPGSKLDRLRPQRIGPAMPAGESGRCTSTSKRLMALLSAPSVASSATRSSSAVGPRGIRFVLLDDTGYRYAVAYCVGTKKPSTTACRARTRPMCSSRRQGSDENREELAKLVDDRVDVVSERPRGEGRRYGRARSAVHLTTGAGQPPAGPTGPLTCNELIEAW
jgi:hypothetical protein